MANLHAASHARDLMIRDMIVVAPNTPLLDIHRLFVEEEIHGAPVVDEEDQVVGVISTLDLLRAMREEAESTEETRSTYWSDGIASAGVDWVDLADDPDERVKSLTAADVMTRELVRVSPEATLRDVARTMMTQRVHRVLVIAQGNLVGVITTFDLLRVIAGEGPAQTEKTGFSRA